MSCRLAACPRGPSPHLKETNRECGIDEYGFVSQASAEDDPGIFDHLLPIALRDFITLRSNSTETKETFGRDRLQDRFAAGRIVILQRLFESSLPIER